MLQHAIDLLSGRAVAELCTFSAAEQVEAAVLGNLLHRCVFETHDDFNLNSVSPALEALVALPTAEQLSVSKVKELLGLACESGYVAAAQCLLDLPQATDVPFSLHSEQMVRAVTEALD